MNIKAFKSLMLLIFGVLLLGQIQEVFPQKVPLEPAFVGSTPTLYTENSAYVKGENVSIRGVNFLPFEMVSVTVRRSDEGAIPLVETVAADWTVIADENGTIRTEWIANFEGTRFTVTGTGTASKKTAEIDFIIFASSADLCQCRNGPLNAPVDCTGANWVNGNLNSSQAHYVEGESVPYRMAFTGLTLDAHSVTIEFDSTQSAKHAIDYLTTFNRTETTANPCGSVASCNVAVYTSWAIPLDPMVRNGFDGILGTADDITQIPGEFRLFGGTITGVSAYSMTGDFTGSSQTRITISFTASVSDPILAWGGHISTRADWGTDNSAIAISGAPYHMRLIDLDGGGGNQDRGLQSGAVYYPGKITIIKDAQPDTAEPFSFTAVGPSVFDFILDDNGSNTDTYSTTQVFSNLTNFGSANTVTVTEAPPSGYSSLTGLTCTSDPNGGGGTNNNNISIPGRYVEIFLEEGEFVTCTFVNTVITAASVSIDGMVLDTNGRGVPNARLVLTNTSTGEMVTTRTSAFGYYIFENITSGETVVISVSARGFVFKVPSILMTPTDNTTNVNFQALSKD